MEITPKFKTGQTVRTRTGRTITLESISIDLFISYEVNGEWYSEDELTETER